MKRCPLCGEWINAYANVCPFCGRALSPRRLAPKPPPVVPPPKISRGLTPWQMVLTALVSTALLLGSIWLNEFEAKRHAADEKAFITGDR